MSETRLQRDLVDWQLAFAQHVSRTFDPLPGLRIDAQADREQPRTATVSSQADPSWTRTSLWLHLF